MMVRSHGEFIYYLHQQSGRYFFCKKENKKREASDRNYLYTVRELSFNKDELELIDFSTDDLNANDKEIIKSMVDVFEK
ncbi:hypothetical protein ACQH80_22145 [Escherichia coli]|uniref:hypothetical protein n=1 Tax=Escherichia coli TaxID=562 RepID=UPI003CF6AB4D